jgi:FKBP-type peptidyl-prolyl cis-trans isomerase 2
MPTLRHIVLVGIVLAGILCISSTWFFVIGLYGHDALVAPVQTSSMFAQDSAVRDGATVTVRIVIAPRDYPEETYNDTEQFIQGQHTVPERIESGVAGMHVGEVKTFSISAEEGFGPRDETNLQLIPTIDLPPGAREGDSLADEDGRYAKVILILPEITLIDLNHPLAGQPLFITLQVVTIQSPDERNNTETENDPPPRQII